MQLAENEQNDVTIEDQPNVSGTVEDQVGTDVPADPHEADGEATDGLDEAGGAATDSDDDGTVISLGGEQVTDSEQEDLKQAPAWVKDLRKSSREKDKEIRELKAQLAALVGPKDEQQSTLPPKPKLEDFDYDTDAYEAKLVEWVDKKKAHDKAQEDAKKRQEEANTAWQNRLKEYNTKKSELKLQDYDDAEENVRSRFSVTQQGIMIQGLDNPAAMIYALGKNAKKAEELASITDPVRFAVAVAKLETQLKITGRKSPPPPPRTATGNAPVSGAVDSQLERLRAEAEKTGDFTKVIAYKRQKQRT